MTNLTWITETYINGNPSIKDAVANKVVNYSKLARKILSANNLDKKYFNAILVAARRFSDKLKSSDYDKSINSLLKNSKINIRDKICRLIIEPHASVAGVQALHVIKSSSARTIIAYEDDYDALCKKYEGQILDRKRKLVEISLITPTSADKVVGFSAHLLGLFASENINVLTEIGSYTDEVFIISSEDLATALCVLRG